jgi:regulator of protease activity HflC (stomatin/prohibitin superfamily)
MALLVVLMVWVVLVVVSLFRSVTLVPQGFSGVVLRFGRYHRDLRSGLALVLPSIDRVIRVDLREQPHAVGPLQVLTRDDVPVTVSAIAYVQVRDPRAALLEVSNYKIAVDQLAVFTLRQVVDELPLADVLSERRQINAAVQQRMQQVTDKWGVRINLVDLGPVSRIDAPSAAV